jgi:hypothetical protein
VLQRTPKAIRQARWRDRQRRDVLYVAGDVPLDVVEALIAYKWLDPNAADDRAAIHSAMIAALRSHKK